MNSFLLVLVPLMDLSRNHIGDKMDLDRQLQSLAAHLMLIEPLGAIQPNCFEHNM